MDRSEKVRATAERLKTYIIKRKSAVENIAYGKCGYCKEPSFSCAHDYAPFSEGDFWGGERDGHCIFTFDLNVPKDFTNPYLEISCPLPGRDSYNPQFTLYIDGEIVQGFDMNHTATPLPKRTGKVLIYAYTGMAVSARLLLTCAYLDVDVQTEKVYYDFNVPLGVLDYAETYSNEYAHICAVLGTAADFMDFRIPYSKEYYNGLRRAEKFVAEELYGKQKSGIFVDCIGHTHIDVAWMWPLAQTKEKVLRSFATAVKLLETYPEYKFTSSQPQLYQYVKERDPGLYDKIKKYVAEGRWEAEGAMWVEPDCNMPNGESLVRQILYGKQFFKEEFGINSHILWLPDAFGYSAALPQILKKSGIDVFVTSKISWNDTDDMPYDCMMWKGIDGSEVFAYFMTAQEKKRGKAPARYADYVADADAAWFTGTYERFRQKELSNEVMLTLGYGDGGGGTTPRQIENVRRLAKGIAGVPRGRFVTADAFFKKLKSRIKTDALPVWYGELYLEYHRGTFTTQARNKRANRKSEFLLRNLELLLTAVSYLKGKKYPSIQIRNLWLMLLKNQFHDILPGSSISEVYRDSAGDYADIERESALLLKKYYEIGGVSDKLFIFNPSGKKKSGYFRYKDKSFYATNVPAAGYKISEGMNSACKVKVSPYRIENKYYKIRFDRFYRISELVDKRRNRKIFENGKAGNVLYACEDYPLEYDAWEIRPQYQDKRYEITDVRDVRIIDEGGRRGLHITRKYVNSTIEQSIFLYDNCERIDFVTEADWHEKHTLLKAIFPLSVNTERTTVDTQFGSKEINTHRNTSWDEAKYEFCMHKFVDLSEGDYGVAVLNDCKYGCGICHGEVGVTLLRSPAWPDPEADEGKLHFTYALYPHIGNFNESNVVEEAYDLNNPLFVAENVNIELPDEFSFVSCEHPSMVIDTVKRSEADDCWVIRMYECRNTAGKAAVGFGATVKSCYMSDLMENSLRPLVVKENTITVEFKPFEIITIKVEL